MLSCITFACPLGYSSLLLLYNLPYTVYLDKKSRQRLA